MKIIIGILSIIIFISLINCVYMEEFNQNNFIRKPMSNKNIVIGITHDTPTELITHIQNLQEIGNQTKEDATYDNVPIQYLNPNNIKNP